MVYVGSKRSQLGSILTVFRGFLSRRLANIVLAGDPRLAEVGEGERVALESCLDSCLVEEADAFLEALLDSSVFSTQTGEEEAFFGFLFLDFWGGDADWSRLLLRFGGRDSSRLWPLLLGEGERWDFF